MKVHFGPNISVQVKSALYYGTLLTDTVVNERVLHTYDEDENALFTFLKNGDINVGNVHIHVEQTNNTHAMENSIVTEVYGYFESDTLESIQKFFETAIDYTTHMLSINNVKEKIKILQFDYKWECDSFIKKKSFTSIHLPLKILTDFKNDIETFLSPQTQQRYADLELNPSRIYALYGPPGTGKTTLIHTIASHYSMNIATLSFDRHMSDRVFKTSLKKIPIHTVLCLEDIDCLFKEDRKSSESFITFSGIINALDGLTKLRNLIVFVTTNHIEKLDPALKRRVDYFVKFDYCVKEQVRDMFDRFLPNEDFETFWEECSKLKLTPSILQKFFICNIHKKFGEYYKSIKNFAEGDYGLEKLPDMYS
jgi:hypothetical protein